MSQLAYEVTEYKNKPGRLNMQILQDPRENVNAVTLRSEQRRVVEPVEPEEEKDPEMFEEDQEGSRRPIHQTRTHPKNPEGARRQRPKELGRALCPEPRNPGPVLLFHSRCRPEFQNST
ncbi:unnamed protein product [Rhodiola kirilowii]